MASLESEDNVKDLISLKILIPGSMGVTGAGQLIMNQEIGVGAVILLEEGEVKEVKVASKRAKEIANEVFQDDAVSNNEFISKIQLVKTFI